MRGAYLYTVEQTTTESTKGGTLLYISDNTNYKCRKDLQIYKEKLLESTFIEIINPKQKNLIIGCIYKHPNLSITEFNQNYIDPLLEKLSYEDKSVILMGDFNINLLNYENENNVSEFLDGMCSNAFLPYITIPTRITPRSRTLIDNIFYNGTIQNTTAGNITTDISDHLAQFLITPNNVNNSPEKSFKMKRDFSKFDDKHFILDLKSINWNKHLNLEKNDVNYSLNKLLDIYNAILNRHAPIKKISNKEIKLKTKPWITKGILTSIKIKNKLYKKYCKAKNESVKSNLFDSFKTYRNLIITLIKKSKRTHYKSFFDNNKKNIINTWKGIKSIININSTTNNQPTCLNVNGKTITNSTEIANSFNNFFSTIAQKIENKLIPTHKTHNDYLISPNMKSIFLAPTTEQEIIDNISSLNINKSIGPNSINTKILKLTKNIISKPLTEIINLSFSTGTFPDRLKIAEIIPIYKKDSKLSTTNYRPISLLSNISKIFEKLMHYRLYSFLDKFECLYKFQYGFRTKHSTKHALIQITEAIRKSIDDGNLACGVFIDLQKAFDTVNHKILINKLSYYGIRGTANDWFKSYLSNRTQYVSVNNYHSSNSPITHGVPQGSVLGPLLFLIYINDLNNAIKHSTTHHFADDTNLLFVNKSIKKINLSINEDLKLLCEWLRANRISLHTSKSEIILFRSVHSKISKHLNFRLSGQKVTLSTSVKYLGIHLDQHLTWENHLKTLKPKLARAAGMLAKIRHYVPADALNSIYFAIFNSHLNYGNQIWCQTKTEKTNQLARLQEKAIRIIKFKLAHEPVLPLFYKMKTLTMYDQVTLENCLFVFDQLNKNIPESFTDYFTKIQQVHDHNTRGAQNTHIYTPQIKTTLYGINSIIYQSITAWNIQKNINKNANSSTRKQFFKITKGYLLKTYCNDD